jgi:hypothetical protein
MEGVGIMVVLTEGISPRGRINHKPPLLDTHSLFMFMLLLLLKPILQLRLLFLFL